MTSSRRGAPAAFPVTSRWTAADRWDAVRCRVGRHNGGHSVLPGIYALNHPNASSPVLASVSYKLTFDLLRRALGSQDCWILVLDTRGMGVGCAMATGTFSTAELAREVLDRRLSLLVDHRSVIVPPLARGALEPADMRRHTGFEIRYGPWDLADLPEFLRAESGLPAETSRARAGASQPAPFGIGERILLIPGELWQSLPLLAGFALVAFVYAGLTPAGLRLDQAWVRVWPLVALGAGTVGAGSLLAPLVPPVAPHWRAVTGWVLGGGVTAALLHAGRLSAGMDPFLLAACYLFFPAAAGYLALRFRKAAPTPDRTAGRRGRWRILGIAAVLAAAALTAAALVLSRLLAWRML